jgi:hypothetical protein
VAVHAVCRALSEIRPLKKRWIIIIWRRGPWGFFRYHALHNGIVLRLTPLYRPAFLAGFQFAQKLADETDCQLYTEYGIYWPLQRSRSLSHNTEPGRPKTTISSN